MPSPAPLPVDAVLPELLDALRTRHAAVLVAPTGAGKTTRVPPALLDGGLAGDGKVLLLEPRRLAARAAARRMASERSGAVGDEVGYRVRFDAKVGKRTRIEVLTEGLFLRRLQADPFLDGVGALVFDEFHERHVDADLAFAMVQRLRSELRPELPLVVMSATLDVEPLAVALGDAPVVRAEGRTYPVDIRYLPAGAADRRLDERVELGVRNVLDSTGGDVLVFLPGVGEIRRVGETLAGLAASHELQVLELFGDLSPDKQDAVLEPGARRKLVLATNVAETSVTIPGVTAVVDTGLARSMRSDPAVGLDRLELGPISRASADQRAGRAGRTAPGVCARLWTEAEHGNRPAHDVPEIQRVDLAGPVLQLAVWGEPDPVALPWLEAPSAAALEHAGSLLAGLGALEAGTPTARGQQLARLPVHPRIGGLLVEGVARRQVRRAALAAALLSERDPFRARRGDSPATSSSDMLDRVRRLEGRGGRGGGVHFVLRAADQLERLARGLEGAAREDRRADDDAFLRLLWAAFPDRLARRRERGSPRGVMVGGRGVALVPESAVHDAELFLCLDLDAGAAGARSEARVRLASAVERDWLPVQDGVETFFDEGTLKVMARRRVRHADLVLEESPAKLPGAGEVAEALAVAAAERLDEALPLDTPEVVAFRERVACLADWMPDLELPALDDDDLRALLPRLCAGKRSFAELRRAKLVPELLQLFDHRQRRALDSEAPERLAVPSGSHLAIRYERGSPPVLAARIQELFGWADTPRLAGGRVPVVLHLLAPNHRPQQVTDDLASFWMNTYPQVRKDLRARYPKHAWPEDPTVAVAERRPRRRR